MPKGSKGTRLRSLGRRPRANTVARFWLLLSRDKSNYPFRGIPANGYKKLKEPRRSYLFLRLGSLLSLIEVLDLCATIALLFYSIGKDSGNKKR
jgi:hypothetical protein